MSILRPLIVVLDTSTLAKVSRDFSDQDAVRRKKARDFLGELNKRCVYLAFTFVHIMELLRHNDDSTVRDRLAFLRELPLIAWLRPYNGIWFPGAIPDLFQRELHAVIHRRRRGWSDVIADVRPTLWETGVGREMFIEDDDLWSSLRVTAQDQQTVEQYVVSVSRTDAGLSPDLTVRDIDQRAERPRIDRAEHFKTFISATTSQLILHGDIRLPNPAGAARTFANTVLKDVSAIESKGSVSRDSIIAHFEIPPALVTDEMTLDELGALGVYIRQLKLLSDGLVPRANVNAVDVPPTAIPSYAIERRLARIQRQADRVSGSDLGDRYIAPLTLYSDAVEVDKRTFEYLTQVKRSMPAESDLMSTFFKSSDYASIPNRLDATIGSTRW